MSSAHVRHYPSRAVAGLGLWCPAVGHDLAKGSRLWRDGRTPLTLAVCPPCMEAREEAALPAWRRALGPWVIVLAFILYAAACVLAAMSGEPLVHPGEGVSIPTEGMVR